MTWSYPYTISNGQRADAAKVQGLFDYARRKVNSVTNAEMAGISEGGVPARVTFDVDGGHNHNDSTSEAIALAVNGLAPIQGSVKVASKFVNVAAISFSSDLVTGTGITKLMGIEVMGVGTNVGEYTTAFQMDADVNDGFYYTIVNPAGATDEAYIFNGIGSTGGGTGGGVDWPFYVVMVGI